jgi:cephalosporin hydroxylase
MSEDLRYSSKAVRVLRSILNSSVSSYTIARAACREGANQHWTELVNLVHLVRQLRPTIVMEIGMDRGGTMALWAQIASADAQLVGLDIKISDGVERLIRSQMKSGQRLSLVEADSHAASTKQRVFDLIGGDKLDFLFIDGDHTYEGAKLDFETFNPLLRPGGLVGFHDIIPDYSVRFGTQTRCNAGGVHRLWRELNCRFPHYEFIDDVGQDGFGIGVVRM